MSLYAFINDTITRRDVNWDYYGAYVNNNPDEVMNIIKNEPKTFIGNYFKLGAKDLVLNLSPNNENDPMDLFSDFRAIHTVSAFFIGLLIERSMNPNKPLSIPFDGPPKHMPFSYLWFLTCLYHDYGYCIEDKDNAVPNENMFSARNNRFVRHWPNNEYGMLHNVRSEYKINYSIYSAYPYRRQLGNNPLPKELMIMDITNAERQVSFSNGVIIRSPKYSSGLAARYFNYCLKELDPPKINHGIIGGQLFYDRMIKSYVEAYEKSVLEHCNANIDYRSFYYIDGTDTYKYFFIEQIPVFKHIADCIIAHNIWKADESSEAIYREYRLDELLIGRFEKISYKTNPILFLLAIADTIEPCKLFKNSIPDDMLWKVWEDYDIRYSKKKHAFTVTMWNDGFSELYDKVKSLESWVDVTCRPGKSQSVVIELD